MIAVILMVAITVVLAAVVYVWVSGFSGENQVSPRSMSVQLSAQNETDATYLVTSASPSLQWTELSFSFEEYTTPGEGYVKAGDSFTVHNDDGVSGQKLTITDVPANSIILTLSIR